MEIEGARLGAKKTEFCPDLTPDRASGERRPIKLIQTGCLNFSSKSLVSKMIGYLLAGV